MKRLLTLFLLVQLFNIALFVNAEDRVVSDKKFISNSEGIEVVFPEKYYPLKLDMGALTIEAYQCGIQEPFGLFTVHIVKFIEGKIISKESRDVFFKNLLQTHLNTHENSGLISSERIRFASLDSMRSLIKFTYGNEGEKIILYRESITMLSKNGDKGYTLSVIYKGAEGNIMITSVNKFFNSFRIIR